jgi:hypothetical protein
MARLIIEVSIDTMLRVSHSKKQATMALDPKTGYTQYTKL